jgi:hypothetical protein
MNFVHHAAIPLTLTSNDQLNKSTNSKAVRKGSQQEVGYQFYRVTIRQVNVQDPNIGCGHHIKLINEWVLRRALYRIHIQKES